MSFPASQLLIGMNASSAIFPEGGSIYTVWEDTPFWEAFKEMIHRKVLSVPVLSRITKKELFVLSMSGIMYYLITSISEDDLNGDIDQILSKKGIVNLPVINIKDSEAGDPAIIVKYDQQLFEVMKIMVKNEVHRLLVHDANDRLCGIITQSQLLKLLSCALDTIDKSRKTVAELNIGTSPVISVTPNQKAFQAFKLMKQMGISSVAVVDAEGKLIGNISSTDIKHLGFDLRYFELLGKSVDEYLMAIRMHNKKLGLDELRPRSVPVKETDLLLNVINLMTYLRVHRLYSVDDNSKPIRVISLQDVLEVVVQSSESSQ
jgi:CBS domain-containing protein